MGSPVYLVTLLNPLKCLHILKEKIYTPSWPKSYLWPKCPFYWPKLFLIVLLGQMHFRSAWLYNICCFNFPFRKQKLIPCYMQKNWKLWNDGHPRSNCDSFRNICENTANHIYHQGVCPWLVCKLYPLYFRLNIIVCDRLGFHNSIVILLYLTSG